MPPVLVFLFSAQGRPPWWWPIGSDLLTAKELCCVFILCVGIQITSVVCCRDHFYQFGEIRGVSMVGRQNCAFVCFTTRSSAEKAAEKSFNSLIIKGRRLRIMWGRGQGQATLSEDRAADRGGPVNLTPVPGLPGGVLCACLAFLSFL